jgi:hypothetical protein
LLGNLILPLRVMYTVKNHQCNFQDYRYFVGMPIYFTFIFNATLIYIENEKAAQILKISLVIFNSAQRDRQSGTSIPEIFQKGIASMLKNIFVR